MIPYCVADWVGPPLQETTNMAEDTLATTLKLPTLFVAISALAKVLFAKPIYTTIAVAACTYFATRLVKQMFHNYTTCQFLERLAVKIIQKAPYVVLVALSVALLFSELYPIMAMIAAATVALLGGLVLDAVYNAISQKNVSYGGFFS